MRAFFTTSVNRAKMILADRFSDLFEFGGTRGVWVADTALDINDGFEGDVTLCLEVPQELFDEFEWAENGATYRISLIPAEVLNRLGKPQIFDHFLSGMSRRTLLRTAEKVEAHEYPELSRTATRMRGALRFFDEIGWLTPLKLREALEE